MCMIVLVILIIATFSLYGLNQSYALSSDEVKAIIQRVIDDEESRKPNKATVLIISNTEWSGAIQDSGFNSATRAGRGVQTFQIQCGSGGIYSTSFQKQTEGGDLRVFVIQNKKILDVEKTVAPYGVVSVAGECQPPFGGGCLIATAAFGSELAPQVQMLRETRDNILLKTYSGSAFMTAFNQFYYTFSPTVADWERENPIFKEAVKITITPLITTLSILNYLPIHSEGEMLFYGIGIILINIGIYFVTPAIVITKLRGSKV